jgi:glycosyltransferase involved in cell wall biosynthesis
MNLQRQLISIVSPAHNEEKNLDIFHAQISEAVEGADFDIEFVIVDDGSRDRTAEVLRSLVARDRRVRALILSRNFGAIAACTAGLQHAVGDAAILMTCDLQEPASNIISFVERWRQGYDIIWAVRRKRDDPLVKSLFADSFYWLIRRLAFADYPKRGTDSGLFSRAALNIYRSLPERDSSPFYAFYTYGFRQGFIEYDRLARLHGTSGWSFWRRVKNAIDVMTGFSAAPLRFITALGVIAMAGAMLGSFYIFVFDLLFNAISPGWSSLMVISLFLGGLQLSAVGILAIYIWRISEQTRQRPRFIIAEAHGAKMPGVVTRLPNILDLDVSASSEPQP